MPGDSGKLARAALWAKARLKPKRTEASFIPPASARSTARDEKVVLQEWAKAWCRVVMPRSRPSWLGMVRWPMSCLPGQATLEEGVRPPATRAAAVTTLKVEPGGYRPLTAALATSRWSAIARISPVEGRSTTTAAGRAEDLAAASAARWVFASMVVFSSAPRGALKTLSGVLSRVTAQPGSPASPPYEVERPAAYSWIEESSGSFRPPRSVTVLADDSVRVSARRPPFFSSGSSVAAVQTTRQRRSTIRIRTTDFTLHSPGGSVRTASNGTSAVSSVGRVSAPCSSRSAFTCREAENPRCCSTKSAGGEAASPRIP
ncbi:hypothetical protein GCM10010439_30400 [Actinocorallia aurantiaca]|uniref:Uncharacterized protein n=1 Tax=Actinocorallia aurantiaca TaxID=46204 RepID=A0ABP6GN37_9ACTN